MADLLELRQDDCAIMAHLFVIEGSPLVFTDHEGLVGTSFITDGREIIPGLDLPNSIKVGINPREGLLTEFSATFRVTETKTKQLADLFRGVFPDENEDRLLGRLSPTDDPAPATIGGVDTTPANIFDRHIGIERIGPAGQRRYWGIHPGTAPTPFDHAWLGDITQTELPFLHVSDELRIWSGRWCALHRMVFDTELGTWRTFLDQYNSGSLIWRGTLQGRGEVFGTAQWSIRCDGPASLTRRMLNRSRSTTARTVVPRIRVEDSQRGIAIIPRDRLVYDLGQTTYDSSSFDAANDLQAETNDALLAELSTLFDDVADGTNKNVDGAGGVFSFVGIGGGPSGSIGVTQNHLSVKFVSASRMGRVSIVMHQDFWALLGFDPATQGHSLMDKASPNYMIFSPFEPGGVNFGVAPYDLAQQRGGAAPELDFTDYWVGEIQTYDPNPATNIGAEPDNFGTPRKFFALYPGGVVSISPFGKQTISLTTGGDFFVPGQKALPPADSYGNAEDRPSIGINTVNSMGWFLLRGELARGSSQFADVEFEEFSQVARCTWFDSGNGAIGLGPDGLYPTMIVELLEDARAFGFDHERITAPWLSGGETRLEAIPLAVFAYRRGVDTVPDAAFRLITRTLLSGGTVGDWGTTGNPTFPPVGDNHPAVPGFDQNISSDMEIADLGLGLEGVAVDITSFKKLQEDTLGANDNPLGLVKLAYSGPIQSEEILGSLLQGRGWCFGWRRRPGDVQPRWAGIDLYSPFSPDDVNVLTGGVALHITDSDIAGNSANNETWIPVVKQTWRSPIDNFRVDSRAELSGGSLTFSESFIAMDGGSRHRHGATSLDIRDDGLSNPDLFSLSGAIDTQFRWRAAFRARFQQTIAEFMSKPHRTITIPVSAPKGQWCYPGQAFLFSNASVNSLDGQTTGVTKAQCVVLETEIFTGGRLKGNYGVTAIMLGIDTFEGFSKLWTGSAHVTGWTDTGGGAYTLVCEEDWTGSGHGSSDVLAFEEPPHSSVGGATRVQIIQSFDGETFDPADAVLAVIGSVDAGTDTITITAATGTVFRDTVKIVTLAPFDDQDTDNWVQTICVIHTDEIGSTHSTGVAGKKLD